MSPLALRLTDTPFRNSPAVGPDCRCSRCGQPILAGAIRVWTHEDGDMEYRYHPRCLEVEMEGGDPLCECDHPASQHRTPTGACAEEMPGIGPCDCEGFLADDGDDDLDDFDDGPVEAL